MAVLSGGEKLQARLAEIAAALGDGGTLRVGFLEGATYPDGTPLATVAAAQNFGAPTRGIPPRPFFSNMVRDGAPGWPDALVKLLRLNHYDLEASLHMLGGVMQRQLMAAITGLQEPALSLVTLLLRDRFPAGSEEVTFEDVLRARRDIANGVEPEASGTAAKPLVWSGTLLKGTGVEVVPLDA